MYLQRLGAVVNGRQAARHAVGGEEVALKSRDIQQVYVGKQALAGQSGALGRPLAETHVDKGGVGTELLVLVEHVLIVRVAVYFRGERAVVDALVDAPLALLHVLVDIAHDGVEHGEIVLKTEPLGLYPGGHHSHQQHNSKHARSQPAARHTMGKHITRHKHYL